jgi:hypothetical protein
MAHSPNKQHRLFGMEMALLKGRATVQIADTLALLIAIHVQLAPFRSTKPPRLFKVSTTMRTPQPLGVKVFAYHPYDARIAIH